MCHVYISAELEIFDDQLLRSEVAFRSLLIVRHWPLPKPRNNQCFDRPRLESLTTTHASNQIAPQPSRTIKALSTMVSNSKFRLAKVTSSICEHCFRKLIWRSAHRHRTLLIRLPCHQVRQWLDSVRRLSTAIPQDQSTHEGT